MPTEPTENAEATTHSFVGSIGDIEREHGIRDPHFLVAPLGRVLALEHFGVNHETILPGGQSSKPHAHSDDEEFVLVLAGKPSLWIDGHLSVLKEGDAVAFPAGTGIAHTFINNSNDPIKLLIVGEHSPQDRVSYPVHPKQPHPRPWTDAPSRPLGPHDGRPDDDSN